MSERAKILQKYEDLGFQLIPLNEGQKTPIFKNYQNAENDILPKNNIGVLTGQKSGITVLDFDFYDKEGKVNQRTINYWNNLKEKYKIEQYVHQKTGSDGFHVFFQYEPDLKTCNLRNKGYDMEIKNNKVYVVLSPSYINENKKKVVGNYKWKKKPYKIEIKKMPTELKEELMTIINSSSMNVENDEIGNILDEEFEGEYKWTIIKENEKSYKILNNCYDCLVERGYKHSDLVHSCIFINNKTVVANCHSHSMKKIKINSNWKKIKSLLGLTKTKSDDEKNNYQILCERMIDIAEENGYKRNSGFIMKPNDRIPVLYENHLEYKDYINEVFNRGDRFENIFDKSPTNMNNLLKFLDNNNKIAFPFLKHNKYICAFNNGYYDFTNPNEEKFIPYVEMTEHYSTSVYFDIDFDVEWLGKTFQEIQTPIIDVILKHHFNEEKEEGKNEFDDIYSTFFGLVGRLHYPVHMYDNFNCCLFIKGSSNTGKSTVGDIIMSSHQNIGTISGKMEGTFGLQSLYKKDVIYISDLPSNFHNKLDKGDLQRMISGETLDIPIKGVGSINNFKWSAPMLFLGNYYFGYTDSSGAIPRRLSVFLMENYVENRDSSIKKRCIKQEGHLILIKSIKAYALLIERFRNKTFEDFDIDYFKDSYNDITNDTNFLYRFLTIPPNSFEKWAVYDEKSDVPFQTFKKTYEKWLYFQDKTLKRKDKTIDATTLRREGYVKKRINICGMCGKPPNNGTCCVNYSNKNRRNKIMIKNMMILEKNGGNVVFEHDYE